MILYNFNSKYDFRAVFGKSRLKSGPKNMHAAVQYRVWVAFGTGFEVWPTQKQLQNYILDQSYGKSWFRRVGNVI